MNHVLKKVLCLLCMGMGLMTTAYAADESQPSPYIPAQRAAAADAAWMKLDGNKYFPLSKKDPEFAGIMKKYIYGDIAQQAKISEKDRLMVTLAVGAAQQNDHLIKRATREALNAGIAPIHIRESIIQTAPYIGLQNAADALDEMYDVMEDRNIMLPLESKATTTDADRFQKGLAYQKATYGEAIDRMRNNARPDEMHLQDDLSAMCFGDVYTRSSLPLKTRELLTCAAIGTLGIESQFRAHVNGALAAGNSEQEIIGVVTAMNPYVGFPRTLWMLGIINQCFAQNQQK